MKDDVIELAGIVKVLVHALSSAGGDYPDWFERELFMLRVKLNDLIEHMETNEAGKD